MSEYTVMQSMKDMNLTDSIKRIDMVRVRDSNNGTYVGGQIRINTQTLASSNELYSLSDAYIEIPYTITIKNILDPTKATFLLAVKDAFYSKINAISVKLNNETLVSFTALSNIHMHFNILSSMNPSDMARESQITGFYKDTFGSYRYAGASDAYGIGESTSGTGSTRESEYIISTQPSYNTPLCNEGYLRRAKTISYNEPDASISPFVATGSAARNFKSHCMIAGTTMTYNICAVVKLAHIHDVFKTMPIMRNPLLELVIQYHSCNTSIVCDATKYTTAVSSNPINNYCPYTLAPIVTGMLDVSGSTMVIEESMTNDSRTICELVIPKISMNEEDELNYINEMGSDKVIKYTNIFSNNAMYTESSINWNVNSNLSNMTAFIMMIRLGSNGNALNSTNAATLNIDHSPFTSSPNFICSSQSVQNLQVLLSNRPVFEAPVQYNYDIYMQMIRERSLNNANASSPISSGLITKKDWEEGGFGYIYVKLPPSSNLMDQSLTVRFTNAAVNKITRLDLLAFIEVDKAYSIDVNTGKVKSMY